ncbi:hypothetical protein GIB67_029685, partial [Kingdonia uniflora]
MGNFFGPCAVSHPHGRACIAELLVDVLIIKLNLIPIPLVDINYLVVSDGRKLVSGLVPDAGILNTHGSETIKIPLKIIYDDIKSTYNDIKEGSVIPYKVLVELIVDLPVVGNLKIPMEKNGEMSMPYKLDLDLEKIKFGQFSFGETSGTLHLKLDNQNDFDMGLNALEYQVWLADVKIDEARLSKSAKIAKKGQGAVEILISFRPKDFGSAMWDMIRGKGTGYSMRGNIFIDTVFGPMNLPFNRKGGSTKLKKAEDNDDEVYEERVALEVQRLKLYYFSNQALEIPTPIPVPPTYHSMTEEEAEDDYYHMWRFHYVVLAREQRWIFLRQQAKDKVKEIDVGVMEEEMVVGEKGDGDLKFFFCTIISLFHQGTSFAE